MRAWSLFAGYLKQQDIPLVIVSHDREFLDQLCTKIVETDIIHRLAGGGQSGRASAAEKALEAIKAEGTLVAKPFVPKKRK
jgi:ATPase subunit of ABC transporter with duplicated ATPase domains